MSTRWYPIFQRGNPQLRVFLPNFTMKLVKPPYPRAKNVVTFEVPVLMTDHDIKNYLEKIYNVPVGNVRSRIQIGEFSLSKLDGTVNKADDYRVADVTLQEGETFTFPEVVSEELEKENHEKTMSQLKEAENMHTEFVSKDKKQFRPNIPSWFGL